MTDISKLCMVCLGEKNENGICTKCRKETDIIQNSPLLPIKSIVSQRYLIAKAHKRNSEGISYGAYDMKLNKPCSIREFFPENIAQRDFDEVRVTPKHGSEVVFNQYISSFISLWTKLKRLKGLTALICVTDVFEANGTAYAVYDESERITLRDYLLDTKEGFIPWEKARILFMPVLSTLGTLHTSGIIHRGINPSSFVFSKDGKLKLTDFSIEPVRTLTGAIDGELFDGYAPLEQYNPNGNVGPWSDIYSFCSVLYRSLIGTTPIDAKTRALNDQMMIPARFAEQLPPYVINALINGMAVEPDDRTDNIEQLRSDLSASPRAIGASAPQYTPAPPSVQKTVTPIASADPTATRPIAPQKANPFVNPVTPIPEEVIPQQQKKSKKSDDSKKKNTLIAVLCVILVLLLCGIGFLVSALLGSDNPDNPENTTAPQTTVVTVPNFVGGYISDIITNEQYTTYFKFKTEEQNSATVMAGMVIAQNVPSGSTASIGETITLTVSSGPRTFALQDVTGWTYEQAEQAYTALGLRCTKSAMHNDGTRPGGTIAETIPAANSVVKEGDMITIVVYTSLEEETTASSNPSGGNSVEQFIQNYTSNQQTNQNTLQ